MLSRGKLGLVVGVPCFLGSALSTPPSMSALASARSLGRSSSLPLPEYVAPVAPSVARLCLRRPALMQRARHAKSVKVTAHMGDKVIASVQEGAKRFMGRYVGCVWRFAK